jgi:uncharacterized FlgJ-related protein
MEESKRQTIFIVSFSEEVIVEKKVDRETENSYYLISGAEGHEYTYRESKNNWRVSFHKDYDSARKALIEHLNEKIKKSYKRIADTRAYIKVLQNKTLSNSPY